MTNQTQAIVRIGHRPRSDTGSDTAAQFKRLALFFDRILFVLPDYWIVKDEVVDDPNRTIRKPGGGYHFGDLDPFRDTIARANIPIKRLGRELDATLSYLVECAIAEEVRPSPIALRADLDEFEAVRSEFGWRDMADEEFIALSGSQETEFRAETATVITDGGKERSIHSVVPPKAVRDSVDITSVLFAAERTSSSPVFTDPAHHAELAYRYRQYKSGLAALEAHHRLASVPDEFLDQFGSVTFQIGNSAIESAQIARFSIEEIVELRESMDDARRRFVSQHLVEATSLIKDNPWSREVKAELERFVHGKLATELLNYDEAAKERVEQLSVRRKGNLIDASTFAAIGASSAALTANEVAGVSPWHLALVAAAVAASKPWCAIRRDTIDKVLEDRKAHRSSIAYLAAITAQPS